MKIIVRKMIVASILLLFLFNCSANRSNPVGKSGGDTLKNLVPYRFEGSLAKLVKAYADSLNSSNSGAHLPRFLWDEDLDVNAEINAISTSNFISLREEIFKRASNLYTMNKIVDSGHFRNQINADRHRPQLSSDKFNNYQLALERKKVLMKALEKAISKLKQPK